MHIIIRILKSKNDLEIIVLKKYGLAIVLSSTYIKTCFCPLDEKKKIFENVKLLNITLRKCLFI